MANIKAIITDFDGTLVDTFEANLLAYQEAFQSVGKELTEIEYRNCFGLRFDDFMREMNVKEKDLQMIIKEKKKDFYPTHFDKLKPNKALIQLIKNAKDSGIKTAIASTARKENLMNALKHLQIESAFNLIFAGKNVDHGKPNPEIYLKTMAALSVEPQETLIFEDSQVGILAALNSGANYIKIDHHFFEQ